MNIIFAKHIKVKGSDTPEQAARFLGLDPEKTWDVMDGIDEGGLFHWKVYPGSHQEVADTESGTQEDWT